MNIFSYCKWSQALCKVIQILVLVSYEQICFPPPAQLPGKQYRLITVNYSPTNTSTSLHNYGKIGKYKHSALR
jgi:hypothetical protein